MPQQESKRGFTRPELVTVMALLVLVLLLPGIMRQRWNGSGLPISLNNVRQLLAATAQYRLDNAERVPMRGDRYVNGQISGGWDQWNAFGKNCSQFWFGSPFDENAYGRLLNPYLLRSAVRIPRPAGYVNTGSGSTWTFNDGSITLQERNSLQVPVCRSPGDVATRQRSWPNQTVGVSGYDDIGTSYVLNMRWWDQSGWPTNFTQRYNAGTERIRNLRPGDVERPYAWIHDQIADVVKYTAFPQLQVKGEFGGVNKSVMGFLTGDADYMTITVNASSGVGYTFNLRP